MKEEVFANYDCIHCSDRECHDGESFCRYAMKENSFYKNPKIYKKEDKTEVADD